MPVKLNRPVAPKHIPGGKNKSYRSKGSRKVRVEKEDLKLEKQITQKKHQVGSSESTKVLKQKKVRVAKLSKPVSEKRVVQVEKQVVVQKPKKHKVGAAKPANSSRSQVVKVEKQVVVKKPVIRAAKKHKVGAQKVLKLAKHPVGIQKPIFVQQPAPVIVEKPVYIPAPVIIETVESDSPVVTQSSKVTKVFVETPIKSSVPVVKRSFWSRCQASFSSRVASVVETVTSLCLLTLSAAALIVGVALLPTPVGFTLTVVGGLSTLIFMGMFSNFCASRLH